MLFGVLWVLGGIDWPRKSRSREAACSEAISSAPANIADPTTLLRYYRGVRVLGIDCGTEFTGYGIVEQASDGKLHYVTADAIKLSRRDPLSRRLARIFDVLSGLILEHKPDVAAIEDVFYAANVKSALKLGQVRGVAMLAAASQGLQVCEYAPLAIKSAVVGYGKAEKSQVQQMVARLLRLPEIPEPPDVADALAIAICHLHTAATLARQAAR